MVPKFNVLKYGPRVLKTLRPLPPNIPRPDYSNIKAISGSNPIHINTEAEIRGIRDSCQLAKCVLDYAGKLIKVGVTTEEIDELVHREVIGLGAYPSPLFYMGFPKSLCTSINNVVCHGIPDERQLEDGDIINLDVTVFYNGFHGDTSKTFSVGNVDAQGQDLVEKTRQALNVGIQQVKAGNEFNQIGNAIESFAREHSYSVEKLYCGHGIGSVFHREPWVLHYENDEPGIMKPGMVFTIEPILCQGKTDSIKWPDGWTVSLADEKRSAQFEHTLLVTENGVEILTL